MKKKYIRYLFYLYLFVLALLTIIPQFTIDRHGLHLLSDYESQINLVPLNFVFYLKTTLFILKNPSYFLINILGNILIFAPIGFFSAYFLKKPNFIKVFLIGLSLSCFIEFIQLFLPRATDIDDILLNGIGCILGYLFFLLYKKLSSN